MSLVDEILKDSNEQEMDFIAKMAVLAAVKETHYRAMALELNVTPLGVNIRIYGDKRIVESLNLEDTIKEFADEIMPTAKKYSEIVSKKVVDSVPGME